MSDEPRDPDEFDLILRDHLRSQSEVRDPDVDALYDAARRMPPRPRFGMFAMATRLPAVAAAIGVIALAAAALGLHPLPGTGAALTPGPPMSTVATATAPASTRSWPSGSDPSRWATDPGVVACVDGRPEVAVRAVYEFARASDYRVRLPSLGHVKSLDNDQPALIVLFRDVSPWITNTADIHPALHSPKPGTRDICVLGSTLERFYDVIVDEAALSTAATVAPYATTRSLAAMSVARATTPSNAL